VDEPMPKETRSDAEYRVLCLRKFRLEALNESCKRRFGKDFKHTPVNKLKAVLTEEALNAMEDWTNE
jgi:hypothetical protein